jgi:hypothetical protein
MCEMYVNGMPRLIIFNNTILVDSLSPITLDIDLRQLLTIFRLYLTILQTTELACMFALSQFLFLLSISQRLNTMWSMTTWSLSMLFIINLRCIYMILYILQIFIWRLWLCWFWWLVFLSTVCVCYVVRYPLTIQWILILLIISCLKFISRLRLKTKFKSTCIFTIK